MDPRPGSLLMVAYYYPPIAAAGSHRTLNFSRELVNLGWRVTVVTCSDFKRNAVDQDLLSRVPAGTTVRRAPSTDLVEVMARWKNTFRGDRGGRGGVGAEGKALGAEGGVEGFNRSGVLDYLSRLLKTPDSMVSFVPGAVLRALPLMMKDRPDVLFSSGPPFSSHFAALCLKSLFSVPWVADFRDPWADNPFQHHHPYPSLRALNLRLEGFVMKHADLVLANTPALEEALRRRYPNLDRVTTLTNGYDPDLIVRLHLKDEGERPGGALRCVHTGNVYGLRSPRHLIHALHGLKKGDVDAFNRIRFTFYGHVDERNLLEEQARSLGVEETLNYPGHVDHREALRRAAGADLLLVLGVMGSEPEIQVPSKLFEYLALKRPILSLSKRGGAIHRILEQSGVPYLLADLEAEDEIEAALRRVVQGDFDGGTDWDGAERFAFNRLAQRLSGLLASLKQGLDPGSMRDNGRPRAPQNREAKRHA